VTPDSQVVGMQAVPVAEIGGRLLLSWYTGLGGSGSSDGSGDPGAALSLNDPATGRLLVAGPALADGTGMVVWSVRDDVAVADNAANEAHCVAFRLSTGQTLWRQDDSESPLYPAVIAAGNLVGYRTSARTDPIVVDVRTRKVVATSLSSPMAPVVTDDGHLALFVPDGPSAGAGMVVFAPR
jgi:hypothetical protein